MMRLKRHLSLMAYAISIVTTTLPGWSAADVPAPTATSPAYIEAEIPQSRLAGSGTFRYFGISIYKAKMWVGSRGYRAAVSDAEKFALELCYQRAFDGKKIAAASIDQIKKLQRGTASQHVQWQAKLEQLFPNVQSGSCITGIYLPQQGARFYLNSQLLGEVSDAEFGTAFFAIWLDPRTTEPSLRTALLAHAASVN
jgi:hypothetical protein